MPHCGRLFTVPEGVHPPPQRRSPLPLPQAPAAAGAPRFHTPERGPAALGPEAETRPSALPSLLPSLRPRAKEAVGRANSQQYLQFNSEILQT